MEDRSQQVVSVSAAMMALAIFFTIVRFWSRALQKDLKLWWDDAFSLLLLIITIVIEVLAIAWANQSLGKHTIDVVQRNPADLTLGLKYLFWGSFIYELGISAAKFSALFFYIRVFGYQDSKLWWKIALCACVAISCAWLVFSIFLTVFQCAPVSGAWNKMTYPQPTCISPHTYFIANSTTNFINDLIIVIIPIPRVVQLQMKPLKKALVVLVLLCGYITVFMGLGQLILGITTSDQIVADVFWYIQPVMLWGGTQVAVAQISLCLPAAFHLIKRALNHGGRSLLSSRDPGSNENAKVSQQLTARPSIVRQRPTRRDSIDEESDLEGFREYGAKFGRSEEVELHDVASFLRDDDARRASRT